MKKREKNVEECDQIFLNNYHQIHKREKMNTFFLFSTEGEKANLQHVLPFSGNYWSELLQRKGLQKKKKKRRSDWY